MSLSKSQAATISASTAETTIVTADPNFANQLLGLIVTSTDAAASTLTLRDGTAGTTRAIFDYPNAALAPGAPLVVNFNPPLNQSSNNNWTIQPSVNAGAYHVLAIYQTS